MGVRLEKVILELDDSGFSTKMVKDAAATALLTKELDKLGKTGSTLNRRFDGMSTRIDKNTDSLGAMNTELGRSSSGLGALADVHLAKTSRAADRADSSINQLTGHLRVMGEVGAIVGPGLIPIGALAVPAVTGLASSFGFAAAGALSLVVASQGVGDALKALNEAALDPTAANLDKAREAMAKIGPEAQAFVARFQEIRPALKGIRDDAAAGWFPGLTDALDDVERVAPRVGALLETIGETGGRLVAEGAKGLAGPEGRQFLKFLKTEAPQALSDFGNTIGNTIAGLGELWMAFTPLNRDFSSWMVEASQSFQDWADGLSETEGFREFVDYIRTNGPKVAEFAAAAADAFLEIVEAAAPLGGPVLESLTAILKVIAAVADSDLGTPIFGAVAAYAALNRVMTVTAGLQTKISGSSAIGAGMKSGGLLGGLKAGGTGIAAANRDLKSTAINAGKATAAIAGLTIATTGMADGMGLSNTASLALLGTLGGPMGTAIGAAVGLTIDFTSAQKDLKSSVDAVNAAVATGNFSNYEANLASLNAQVDAFESDGSIGDALGDILNPVSQLSRLKDVFDGSGRAAQAARDDYIGAAEAARLFAASEAMWKDKLEPSTGGLADALAGPLGQVGKAFVSAGADAESFARSLALANNLLEGRGSYAAYRAAILDANDAIKENGQTLNLNTRAGQANRTALDGLAASSLTASQRFKGMERVKFLDGAREEFIAVARAMGMGNRAAALLANQLGLLSKTEPPKLDVDDSKAQAKLRRLRAAYDSLPKNIRTELAAAIRAGDPAKIDALLGKYKLTTKQRIAILGVRDLASKDINTVLRALGVLGKTKTTPKVDVQTAAAQAAINNLRANLATIQSKTITVTTRSIRVAEQRADGGLIVGPGGPRDDVIPALLSNGEYVVKASAVDRYGVGLMDQINAKRFADGGFTGDDFRSPLGDTRGIGTPISTTVRTLSEVKQIMAEIRDLKKLLDAEGKDELSKQRKKVVALELKAAEKRLKVAEKEEELQDKVRDKLRETRSNLQGVGSGFSLDSLAPDNRTKTVVQGAQATIAQLRRDVIAAGGAWSKDLVRWSKGLIAASSELDDVNAALVRETAKRDELVSAISDQQQALDQLTSTMKAFGDSVAGNFLTNPFGARKPGDGGGSPELLAAQEQLKAIRESATGDSVALAARASELIAQIKRLQGAGGDGEELTGLAKVRKTLLEETAAAEQMATALAKLASLGLDTAGAMGGLYKSLAESGDLQTAQELAALTAGQVDEYEKLFAARENAAAVLAAQTTQAVYGQQSAALQSALSASQAELVGLNANVANLTATTEQLGAGIRAMGPEVAKALRPQLDGIDKSIKDVGRDTAERLRRLRAVH